MFVFGFNCLKQFQIKAIFMSIFSAYLPLLPLLQSIFFLILFLSFFKKSLSYILLTLNFIFLFLGFTIEYFSSLANYSVSSWSYYIFFLVLLSVNPLFYLFIKSILTEHFKFKLKYLFHFLPSLLFFILSIFIIYYLPKYIFIRLVENNLIKNDYNNIYLIILTNIYWIVQYGIYNIQLLFYSILIFIMLRKYMLEISKNYSNAEKMKVKWIYVLIIINLLFNIWDIASIYIHVFQKFPDMYYLMNFLYITLFGINALKHQLLLTKNDKIHILQSVELLDDIQDKDDNEQSFKIVKERELIGKLEYLMNREQLFLNPDLKLNDISQKLKIHRNVISKVINQHWKVNFFQWVNNYRLEKAKELLSSHDFNHLSIEGIAKTVGFNSKSVFNPLFKKKYGITPSDFRKKYAK